jgi:hypothetical protein
VLLVEIETRAREAGWITGTYEVRPNVSGRAVFAREAKRALESLSGRHRMKGRAKRAMRALASFSLVLNAQGGVELRVNADPLRGVADSGDLDEDLAELFVEMGRASVELGGGVLFLLDEMHFLELEALEALAAALHRVAQEKLPVAVIGAGLPQLPSRLTLAKSYAERLFAYAPIDRLDREASRRALVEPAEKLDVHYETAAAEFLVDRADGYPYFLQELGSEAWSAATGSPITLDSAERAEDRVRTNLVGGFFRSRFEKAEPAERRFMQAMANLGGVGPYAVRDVADQLGSRSIGTNVITEALRLKGFVYDPIPGHVDFTVPQFADYLRRKHPL